MHHPILRALGALPLLLAACQAPEGSPEPRLAQLSLVETTPLETELDHADIPETKAVWLEMIDGAEERIDLEQYYAINREESALEEVVQALERAAGRGVEIRIVAHKSFYRSYPETLDRLAAHDGVELRLLDLRSRTRGKQHARYMLIDGRELFLGSHNFDWRALEHIHELGARVQHPDLVQAFADVFEHDWAISDGKNPPAPVVKADDFPVTVDSPVGELEVTPVFSPKPLLPDDGLWDLPRIVAWIDAAEERVWVQQLKYSTVGRDRTTFDDLDGALKRAAARGVDVRVMLSDWCKQERTIGCAKDLQQVDGIEVRMVTLPAWSGGFIPFARVAHPKYMVVDGERLWLGSGNWEAGDFLESRSAGLMIEGSGAAERLADFFLATWNGSYVETVDPTADYVPPRISE